jgi:hypothetical protein
MRYSLLALLLGGCVTSPQVVPANEQQQVSASAAGATLTAFLSPWEGEPSDLTDAMTPIAIEVSNQGPVPVRFSYLDLALTDENGHRFFAYNPYVSDGSVAALDGVKVAIRGGGGHFGGGGGGVRVAAPRRVGGVGAHPVVRGFHGVVIGAPGYRGFAPWRRGPIWNPLWYPPGYLTWVWLWSPRIYPVAPPPDVRDLGLPEGVLDPGGRASGYVYFEPSAQRSPHLALSWDVHSADGQPMGRATVPLEVIR